MQDIYSDKLITSLPSNIVIFFVDVDEQHDDVEFGEARVNFCDSFCDRRFVLGRVEVRGNVEMMKRHFVC
jgi:hypothetical protein